MAAALITAQMQGPEVVYLITFLLCVTLPSLLQLVCSSLAMSICLLCSNLSTPACLYLLCVAYSLLQLVCSSLSIFCALPFLLQLVYLPSLLKLVCSSLSTCIPFLLCLAIWLLFLCVSLCLVQLTPPPPFLSISIPIMRRVSCLLLCLCLTMHLSRIEFARIGTGWLLCFYYFLLLEQHDDFRGPDII